MRASDRLGFDDWYGIARSHRGTCRGEAEGVLGTEAWNSVTWAIDTSNGTLHVDEPFRKVDRNPIDEIRGDASGGKPGYWDTTDGSYRLYVSKNTPHNEWVESDRLQNVAVAAATQVPHFGASGLLVSVSRIEL